MDDYSKNKRNKFIAFFVAAFVGWLICYLLLSSNSPFRRGQTPPANPPSAPTSAQP